MLRATCTFPMPCGSWRMTVSMKHKTVCPLLFSQYTHLSTEQLRYNYTALCTALNQAGRQSEAIGLLEQLASNAAVECRCVFWFSAMQNIGPAYVVCVPRVHSVAVDRTFKSKCVICFLCFAQSVITFECMCRFEDAAYYNWLMAASHKNRAMEVSDGKHPTMPCTT